jgi:hypothetical protein
MLDQFGRMNVGAISGGRVVVLDDSTIRLPVSCGYAVEVEYVRARDLYEVRRVRTTRGISKVVGTVSHLDAEQMPGAAFRASCYASDPFP